jgi:hypothetical protein
MHALHLGFLGKLHIEAFVAQARLVSRTGLFVQCTAYLKAIDDTTALTLLWHFASSTSSLFPHPLSTVNLNFASSTTTTPRPQPTASSHQPPSISKDTTTSLRV